MHDCYILGCRRVFHNEKEPAFKAIYNMFDKVDIFSNLNYYLNYF